MPIVVRVLTSALAVTLPAAAIAAPTLTSAAIRIVVTSPTSCEVTMTLRVEGASEVEHRIEAFDGADIDRLEVRGADLAGGPEVVGRTRAIVVRFAQPAYEVRYRTSQGMARRNRCPLWLPAVPTTGQLDAVRVEVVLPEGSRASGTMPALAWTDRVGTATLGHVPAFVHVPYVAAGEPEPWDLLRLMDGIAMAVFIVASGVWLWRRSLTTHNS